MKTLSLHWVATLAFVLVTSSATATFAQTTPSTTAPATTNTDGGKHHRGEGMGVLTDAEKAELKADRDKVFAADPSLKAEADSLKEKFKSASTPEDKKAVRDARKDHEAKVKAAILKIDPSAAAIFTKLEAARHGHHDQN